METLKDPEWNVRRAAAAALGHFSKQKDVVVPSLLKALDDGNAEVKAATVLALGRLGRGSDEVKVELKKFEGQSDPAVGKSLIMARAFMGKPDEKSLPVLMEAMCSKDKAVQEAALDLLEMAVEEQPAKTLPALVKLLETPGDEGARHALKIIRRAKEHAIHEIPKIAALYGKGDAGLDAEVIRTLTTLDKDGDKALPVTVKAIEAPDLRVRRQALQGIARYRQKTDVVVKALTVALKDADEENRLLALGILRGLGADAVPALPAITALTKDPVVTVRTSAILALGTIRPAGPEVIKTLQETLKSPAPQERAASVTALKRIGGDSPEIVTPILEKARDDEKDPKIKQIILGSLAGIGSKAENGDKAPDKKQ
jgi:HEAT repeat protein